MRRGAACYNNRMNDEIKIRGGTAGAGPGREGIVSLGVFLDVL